MAVHTSPEQPLPVRSVSQMIGQWVARLGRVWVEGQVTQITRRPGSGVVFLALRDPHADVSLSITCGIAVLDSVQPPLTDGARVVVHGKPDFYINRGSLSLNVTEIRPVGLGVLLARLEERRRVLAAEGLFAAGRKRPLPFLPHTVGVICGRASAAERDVLENARARWPAVRFDVRAVAVQGPYAVSEMVDAVRRLDREPNVEVIVIARGGGSVEDLLPFSDEGLVRAVAECRTPVVSAIGHEADNPLLDLVADVRASTPTDAARLVVPDVRAEAQRVVQARDRLRAAVGRRVRAEQDRLTSLLSRPVLADPFVLVDGRALELERVRERALLVVMHRLDRAADDLAHTRARVLSLSPAATLERGYAVVQRADGVVVRSPEQVSPGIPLRLRVAHGEIAAVAHKAS
ncbi:MAG: exodeoxyribonuclease VII large subunit [Candidatus Nanopelagicales bacterium]